MNTQESEKQIEEIRRICKKYNCAFSQWTDYATLEENQNLGLTLCGRCKGTGNEFFAMYRECPECSGKGYDSNAKVIVTRWRHPDGPSDLILEGTLEASIETAKEFWPEGWEMLTGTQEEMQEYTFKTLPEFES